MELSWNDKRQAPGEIDDLVGHDVGLLHIEQMDDKTIWMSIGHKNFHFYIVDRRLILRHSWDNE